MTHNILSGIRVARSRSAPTALIRRALFKNFVKYSRYGYEMKALGPKITVKVILMSQFKSLSLEIPEIQNSVRFFRQTVPENKNIRF